MQGRRRWVALGIIVGLSAGVVASVLFLTSYYPAYRSALDARDDLQAAQALLRDRRLDASVEDLALAEAHLAAAEDGFARAASAFSDPLLSVGQRLPFVGGSLRATAGLSEIGLEGARLGHDAIAMTRTFQEQRDSGKGPLTEQTKQLLDEVDPAMVAIEERLEGIRRTRDQIDGDSLPGPLAAAVDQLDGDLAELDQLVRTFQDLSVFLPEVLGFDRPRTYLLLAQNNAELLPTGGLISVYGVITLRDGGIEEKRFGDAVKFGARWLEETGAYIEPPAPLQRYLLKDMSWNLAVANWSPHYPTAAQQAERFFTLGGGRPVDGVIAINVRTIEELLRVTGPVWIEQYGVTVSAENALDVIEEHTRHASEPEGDRKAFVGLVADELFSRLMHTPAERWTALIDAVERLRDQRQLLFFSRDAELQAIAHRLELDGALEKTGGDYLMLVDASVHSTKLNIVLQQRIEVAVTLDAAGTARHRVTISYHNDLPAWALGRDPGLVERLMLGGLYGGYVRLIAPYSSRLESIVLGGREVGPEEVASEQGKAVFGRYFSLGSGEQTELTFEYTSFATTRVEDGDVVYTLLIQKQSGTGPLPVSLSVSLPEFSAVRSAELDGAPIDSLDRIETDLAEDRELTVRYRFAS